MKLVSKPIDVLAMFVDNNVPCPCKFRYTDEEGDKLVVKVDRVVSVRESEIPGVKGLLFHCQTVKGMNMYEYQLWYNPLTYRWVLYKANERVI